MSFRRPTHDDDTFSERGITYWIEDSRPNDRSYVDWTLPWRQVNAIKRFISGGGIWKNCPIYVDRWTFGMILYDMEMEERSKSDDFYWR